MALAIGGVLHGSEDQVWCGAEIDTRRDVEGKLFFALRGSQTDGHEYIEQAVAQGCAAVVSTKPLDVQVPNIQVDDTRVALLELAKFVRSTYDLHSAIAITGSVGKTTTKNILGALLGEGAVISPRSFNNDLGIPLTLLSATDADDLVIEVGANACGEIKPLAELISPNIAILTSIQKAHLEGFGSIEAIVREKVALLEALPKDGVAIVADDIRFDRSALRCHIRTVGESNDADIRISTSHDASGCAVLDMGQGPVRLQLLGKHNALNGALAIVAANIAYSNKGAQQDYHTLLHRLANVKGPAGRLHKMRFIDAGVTLIDDSYNANPASMTAALETFAMMRGHRTVAILGDMLELGAESDVEHRRLGGVLSNLDLDQVVLVGGAMEATKKVLPDAIYEEQSDDATMSRIARSLRKGDLVLLKGSRGLQLERIIEFLQTRPVKVNVT